MLETPFEITLAIASSAKAKRLILNLTQASLAMRAGVSLAVLKKFERTGKISLDSLLRLAMVLGCLDNFTKLFPMPSTESFRTIDEIIRFDKKIKGRKRGRK